MWSSAAATHLYEVTGGGLPNLPLRESQCGPANVPPGQMLVRCSAACGRQQLVSMHTLSVAWCATPDEH